MLRLYQAPVAARAAIACYKTSVGLLTRTIVPQKQLLLLLFFFFSPLFFLGELFITHTCTCNKRNHKRQMESRPQLKLQATPKTWIETDIQVCKRKHVKQNQPSISQLLTNRKPSPFIFIEQRTNQCPNQPNRATAAASHDRNDGVQQIILRKPFAS